jgi:hypothetical protein
VWQSKETANFLQPAREPDYRANLFGQPKCREAAGRYRLKKIQTVPEFTNGESKPRRTVW